MPRKRALEGGADQTTFVRLQSRTVVDWSNCPDSGWRRQKQIAFVFGTGEGIPRMSAEGWKEKEGMVMSGRQLKGVWVGDDLSWTGAQ